MMEDNIENEMKRLFKSASAEDFIGCRDKLHSDLFAFLTPHTKLDYEAKGTRLFLSQDLCSGFGVNPDGELISVFALEKQRGRILVAEARKQGAKYLSCMGDHLFELYSQFDFGKTEVLKWDNQFAPKNWNYERFGNPNIYEMRLLNPYKEKFD